MNYFEYFSEIEERFVARRGSLLLLSPLDWALIEVWRDAGVPLRAVLRGIDTAFDRYEARKARANGRTGKVNGLAWCAQAVMAAATEMADAAIGARGEPGSTAAPETGFEAHRVARFLERNAAALAAAAAREEAPAVREVFASSAARLRELAAETLAGTQGGMDDLDRLLTVIEERLQGALVAGTPESELVALRESADRELALYRSSLGSVQRRQLREQMVHKRLFTARGLPRLSLFYMPVGEATEDGDASA